MYIYTQVPTSTSTSPYVSHNRILRRLRTSIEVHCSCYNRHWKLGAMGDSRAMQAGNVVARRYSSFVIIFYLEHSNSIAYASVRWNLVTIVVISVWRSSNIAWFFDNLRIVISLVCNKNAIC